MPKVLRKGLRESCTFKSLRARTCSQHHPATGKQASYNSFGVYVRSRLKSQKYYVPLCTLTSSIYQGIVIPIRQLFKYSEMPPASQTTSLSAYPKQRNNYGKSCLDDTKRLPDHHVSPAPQLLHHLPYVFNSLYHRRVVELGDTLTQASLVGIPMTSPLASISMSTCIWGQPLNAINHQQAPLGFLLTFSSLSSRPFLQRLA